MKHYKFPNNFLLGGSTSGPQTEGKKDKKNDNIFDFWYKNNPEDFYEKIGPDITSNFYETYVEDVDLLEKVGIKIYRTSIQWTRLFKNIETWELDEKAISFYKNYFLKIKSKGIKLIVNLFHFDIPIFWHDKGGWENKEFVEAFAKYASICFNEFKDLVDDWATMNEPIVVSESFYTHDYWWPKYNNFKRGVQVSYNQLLANAKAIKEFKKMFSLNKKKRISIILNLTPSIPKDSSLENLKAAEMRDLFSNKFFLDTAIKGTLPKKLIESLKEINCMFEYNEAELKIIKENTIDFLGINYYAPGRVQAPKLENKNAENTSRFFEFYSKPGMKMNVSRGWEIYPESIRNISETLKKDYKNIEWFMAENGMGVQNESNFLINDEIQDDYRIEYIRDHMIVLSEEIQKGANCFAYCIWSPIDCWSWANAYKNRYGLISINLETQKRTIKKSGWFFKKVSDTKQI